MTYFTKQQLAARLSVSTRTIELWVKSGKCPKPFKIGRHCLWECDLISNWLASARA